MFSPYSASIYICSLSEQPKSLHIDINFPDKFENRVLYFINFPHLTEFLTQIRLDLASKLMHLNAARNMT